MRGILKTEVLPWHKRPVWYDVWETFPPEEPPEFQRPLPEQNVQEILYPEDYVRAKISETYKNSESVNLMVTEPGWKTQQQMFVENNVKLQTPGASVEEVLFVENYVKLQTPGASVEEVLQKTEALMAKKGSNFFTRKVPLTEEDKVQYQPPKLTDKYFELLNEQTDNSGKQESPSGEDTNEGGYKGL